MEGPEGGGGRLPRGADVSGRSACSGGVYPTTVIGGADGAGHHTTPRRVSGEAGKKLGRTRNGRASLPHPDAPRPVLQRFQASHGALAQLPHAGARAARQRLLRGVARRRGECFCRRAPTPRGGSVLHRPRTTQRLGCCVADAGRGAGGAPSRRQALCSVCALLNAERDLPRAARLVRVALLLTRLPGRRMVQAQAQQAQARVDTAAAPTDAAVFHAFWKSRGVRLPGQRTDLVQRAVASGGLYSDTHGAPTAATVSLVADAPLSVCACSAAAAAASAWRGAPRR